MVAMMISLVGLMGMAQLLAVSLRNQQLGRNSTEAIRLAQEMVDQLTTLSFATAPVVQCGGSLTADVANHFDDVLNADGTRKGFRRRWVVAAGPDADLGLRTVTIRVTPDINDRNMASVFELTSVIRGVAAPCP
jgi:hypothetical protein